jgi:hypothetical protein
VKTLSLITTAFILLLGTVASRGANLERISAATGVPVETLQAERASTGLGWGGLEKAHLLANESGRSFDDIVALHKGGQGWGKIANDNGLNLGKLVSEAHRSDRATLRSQSTKTHGGGGQKARTQKLHGKSATKIGRGARHDSSVRSGMAGSRSMRGMGRARMGHGGRGR